MFQRGLLAVSTTRTSEPSAMMELHGLDNFAFHVRNDQSRLLGWFHLGCEKGVQGVARFVFQREGKVKGLVLPFNSQETNLRGGPKGNSAGLSFTTRKRGCWR